MSQLSLSVEKRKYFSMLTSLALPIALQNLISTSLSFVDTLMIGQIGVNEIAGVGLGNQIFFLYSLLIFGIGSGSSVFISQFYGANQIKKIQGVMLLAFSIALFGGLIFAILSVFFPELVLSIFTTDVAVIGIGKQYLQIVGFSYLFTAISSITSITLRATRNAKTPLLVTFTSLGFNALFNYFLIFGIGPFPELGVKGAAIATFLARLLELVLITILSRRNNSPAKFSLREARKYVNKDFILPYIRTCAPVVLNEFFWALGMTAYRVVYARMGTDILASTNVSNSIGDLFFTLVLGVGNAAGVMIGNKIGQKDESGAITYAKWLTYTSIVIGLFFGALKTLTSSYLPTLFNVGPEIYEMIRKTLFLQGFAMVFQAWNTVNIVGILRGGGDTKFAFFTEMGSVWLVGVPCAIISGLVFKLPIYWVCLIVCMDEISKIAISTPRIISKKWVHNLTNVG